MAYTVDHQLPCTGCGAPTYRRIRRRREPVCLDCALKHMHQQTADLAARKGAYYDDWQQSMRRYADTLPSTVDGGPPPTVE